MFEVDNRSKQQPDPLAFCKHLWPYINLYDKQREILYSVRDNDETYVPAANKLGKDYVGAIAVLYFFLTRHPCRVVTTSATADHFEVLWGEMGRLIQSAAFPLTSDKGGPLLINHNHIRKYVRRNGEDVLCKISYIKGIAGSEDSKASLQGHHVTPEDLEQANDGIPRSMAFVDEASSVKQFVFEMMNTWYTGNRLVVIGNTWDCNNNFKWAVKGTPDGKIPGGDIPRLSRRGFYRKVFEISALDSPNVKLGLEQKRLGLPITNEILIPGVKSYEEFAANDAFLDERRKSVVLWAKFYEGSEVMLYPALWLERAKAIAKTLQGVKRTARAIGIDPAEGGDNTCMAASDEFGLIELVSKKTPDTSVIPGDALAFAFKWGCSPDNIVFDAGGGGKQHADKLRADGHTGVRSVSFGEAATPVDKLKRTFRYRSRETKVDHEETKYIFKNRRAEIFGTIRMLIDPSNEGFGIPCDTPACVELLRQLAPIPLWYDEEGRLYLPPKHRKPDAGSTDKKETLTDLIGCSPDEADAFALSVYGMLNKPSAVWAGAAV